MNRGPYANAKCRVRTLVNATTTQLYLQAIGRCVRDARLAAGLTQKELSSRAGVNVTGLNRIEQAASQRGPWKTGPRVETIIRIAVAMGMNPSELLP